jgi:hypothetical protein
MKSVVSGVAGSVRLKQLNAAGLTTAEKHGKRLDQTGKTRAIDDTPPLTRTGLDLNALYTAHVEGAFIPKAKTKAMHMILQFPKNLVDPADAPGMLDHARAYVERVFGPDAIFGDRIDRDEKNKQVVDLFIAPKYVKRTKKGEKIAVSMTRDLKKLAEKHGHPPIPQGIGRAMQDELLEYFRDVMELDGVQRGAKKAFAGPDWKSAEQQRVEELEGIERDLGRERLTVQEAMIALAEKDAVLDAERQQIEAERAQVAEARARILAEGAALADQRLVMENERAELRREHDTLEAAKAEHAKQIREAAETRASLVQLAIEVGALRQEHEREKSAIADDREENRQQTEKLRRDKEQLARESKELTRQRSSFQDEQKQLEATTAAVARREQQARAMEIGLKAIADGEIAGAVEQDGEKRLMFTCATDARKAELRRAITPVWDRIWDFVHRLRERLVNEVKKALSEERKLLASLTQAYQEAVTDVRDRAAKLGAAVSRLDDVGKERAIQFPEVMIGVGVANNLKDGGLREEPDGLSPEALALAAKYRDEQQGIG